MNPTLKKILWLVLASLIVGQANAQPLPPGVTFSVSNAVFAVAPPATTNALPFDFWPRQSGGWTLFSIASKTNVLKFNVVACTNTSFAVTNAEWNIQFKDWPATQHLHGFGINDGKSLFGPPKELYYRVTQFK
jgi:hypothetical protein